MSPRSAVLPILSILAAMVLPAGPTAQGQEVHLFAVEPTVQRIPWSFGANDYLFADAHIKTPNEPSGMVIRYYLRGQRDEGATIIVSDSNGGEVARLDGETSAGINTVVWNMRPRSAGGARGGGGALDRLAPPGEYVVTLEIAGERFTRSASITNTQGWSLGPFPCDHPLAPLPRMPKRIIPPGSSPAGYSSRGRRP